MDHAERSHQSAWRQVVLVARSRRARLLVVLVRKRPQRVWQLADGPHVSPREQHGAEPFARPGDEFSQLLYHSIQTSHKRIILSFQIVLSHFSRSTADLGPTESFPHRQLRTTTDVICHPSVAFLHGGLHLQVTHHLFPRLPRHNLLEASYLVKDFAKEQGLEYAEFGFVEGNGEIRSTLKGVADQLKIMSMVTDAEIREAMEAK